MLPRFPQVVMTTTENVAANITAYGAHLGHHQGNRIRSDYTAASE